MDRLSLDASSMPGMTPDVTPAFTSAETFENDTPSFDEVEVLDHALIPSIDEEDQTFDPTQRHTTTSSATVLTQADVKTDPILSALAKQQRRTSTFPTGRSDSSIADAPATVFKARPAPSGMRDENAGPRMTKAAALRLGLKWDDKANKSDREGKVLGFENTPGHKRASMSFSIASLSSPTLMPRQNKSSQLRSGQTPVSSPAATRRDPEAIAAANKARADEEKARRRASISLPASLSAPTIVPRANKASALRTGVPDTKSSSTGASTTLTRSRSTLGNTSAANVGTTPGPKPDLLDNAKAAMTRRTSVGGVKSLGAPSIPPRLNKAAMLRAPGLSETSPKPVIDVTSAKTAHSAPPKLVRQPSAVKPVPKMDATSGAGPRPTKSSLLRAGMGAKVSSN